MKAKCINDKSEEYPNFKGKSSQNKVTGLTKDKSYEVEQSKQYDDYFEVLNDLRIKESYKKERFEVMEDKTIKVKCINATGYEWLEKDEIYNAIEKEDCYLIMFGNINNEYSKDRFEKAKDILMVECVCNLKMNPAYYSYLTLGKKYAVIEEAKEDYLIKNDKGEKETWYSKKLFKPVKSQNINQEIDIDSANKSETSFTDKVIKSAEKEVGKQLKEKIMKALEVKKEEEQPINYEEEYKKLKEENEALKWSKEECKKTIDELKETRDYLNKANVILEKEIRNKAKDNAKLRQANAISYDEYKESLEILEEENKQLKKDIEETKEKNKNFLKVLQVDIDNLKAENERLTKLAAARGENNKKYEKEIEQLKQRTIMPDYKQENDMLRCQFEEAKKHIETLEKEAIKDHDRIKDRDIEIKQLKFNLEQANNLGKSTNEYYYNWIECQEENERLKKEIEGGYQFVENKYKNKLFLAEQKANETINSLTLLNDKYMEKQKTMESDLIKYENTIKTLKGIIKNISEVL